MKRHLLAVAAVSLLPALGILAYNEWSIRQLRTREIERQALESSRQIASEVERIIDGVEALLIVASALPVVADGNHSACVDALKAMATKLASIQTIALIGPDGKLVCDSSNTPVGLDVSDRSYFKLAKAAGARAIGDYTESRLSGKAVLPVAIPLKRSDDKKTGVLVAGIKLDWLGDRLRERGLTEGNAYTIADRNGFILAREPYPERFIGGRIPDEYKDLLYASQAGTTDLISRDGTERILGFQPVPVPPVGLYVSVGISKREAFATINRLTYASLLLIVIGALIAFSGAWIVGDVFIRRPINYVVETLRQWQSGHVAARTGMQATTGEIQNVGDTVDKLLDELAVRLEAQQTAEQRRDLVMREMAHRIRNTLGIVTVIARQTFGGAENSSNLSGFMGRIVSLSGAYDLLLEKQSENADLIETIEKALKPFQSAESCRIVVSGDTGQLPPQGVISLSLVVYELATNASKYGALSNDDGVVLMTSKQTESDPQAFSLLWSEKGGPQTRKPERAGFGTRLMRNAFPSDYHPHFVQSFDPSGLRCEIYFRVPRKIEEPPSNSGN